MILNRSYGLSDKKKGFISEQGARGKERSITDGFLSGTQAEYAINLLVVFSEILPSH